VKSLVKAVVPSLAPLAYFHPKSHPPLSQKTKTPYFRRRWQESKNFLTQLSVGSCSQHIHLALNSHSARPSWRRYFVFLFCTTTLQAHAMSASNDKHGSKSVLGPCGCDLQHDEPRRDIPLLLLTACSFHISAAFGPTPTFSSAALRLKSSDWKARHSVHVNTW